MCEHVWIPWQHHPLCFCYITSPFKKRKITLINTIYLSGSWYRFANRRPFFTRPLFSILLATQVESMIRNWISGQETTWTSTWDATSFLHRMQLKLEYSFCNTLLFNIIKIIDFCVWHKKSTCWFSNL